MYFLDMKYDPRKTIDQLTAIQKKQMPYATSLALTATAFDCRSDIQKDMPNKFDIRQKYIIKGVKVEKSTKSKQTVTPAWVYYADDYFDVHEFGGDRTGQGAEGFSIVSTQHRGKAKRMPTKKRAKGIIDRSITPKQAGRLGGRGNKRSGARSAAFRYLGPNSKRGTGYIAYRHKRSGRLITAFVYQHRAKYQKRWGFIKLANQTASIVADSNFANAINKALSTARP